MRFHHDRSNEEGKNKPEKEDDPEPIREQQAQSGGRLEGGSRSGQWRRSFDDTLVGHYISLPGSGKNLHRHDRVKESCRTAGCG
jgi:hypothetical protein